MLEGKANKILFMMLLFSLSTVISSSYDNMDLNKNQNAFAQTSGPHNSRADPVPENDYTPGNGPIPEDNSTDIGNGPIPEDNSASTNNSLNPPGMSDFDSLTNSGLPDDVNSIVNNATNQVNSTGFSPALQGTTQTNPPSVPEFGSLAPIILVIAISSMIIFRTKLSK